MPVSFSQKGSGLPVVFIHGFPMSKEVWTDFADRLSENYCVFTVDLPGFGQSSLPSGSFTLETIADILLDWMREQKLSHAVVIGHSLGGYVALSMVEKEPDRFPAFVLLHSTASSDSVEKKESRNKVLEFIDKNGVKAFTSNFISPLFADQAHPAIEKVRAISTASSADAVKGYTVAMRDRKDRRDVIQNFSGKSLLIGGEKDGGITPQSLIEQAALNTNSQAEIITSIAHMGMFEAPEIVFQKIHSFLSKIPVTK
jgi:pimeloyl-ACP methyl ester carboxylesterase